MKKLKAFASHVAGIRSGAGPSSIGDAALTGRFTTSEEAKQRLRLNRFLLAAAFSILYLLVLAVFYTQGKVDIDALLASSAIVLALILVFFSIFRLGLNLLFTDPSLTTFQVLAAVFTMLFGVYRAPDTRLVFATFFFVALMFGMLRSSGKQLTILWARSRWRRLRL